MGLPSNDLYNTWRAEALERPQRLPPIEHRRLDQGEDPNDEGRLR